VEIEPMVNVKKLSELFGPPTTWFYEKAERGVIPSYRCGKYRLFRISEVAAWIEAQRQGPRPA
jgi:excisionase family DNA binding protein